MQIFYLNKPSNVILAYTNLYQGAECEAVLQPQRTFEVDLPRYAQLNVASVPPSSSYGYIGQIHKHLKDSKIQ